MKQLKMYFMWPILFSFCWYFFGFIAAVIIGFLYLHIMIVLLLSLIEAQKEKLLQIVQHISNKDGLADPNKIDFSNIMTANDIANVLTKIKK